MVTVLGVTENGRGWMNEEILLVANDPRRQYMRWFTQHI